MRQFAVRVLGVGLQAQQRQRDQPSPLRHARGLGLGHLADVDQKHAALGDLVGDLGD
jgi:hypothetical protein